MLTGRTGLTALTCIFLLSACGGDSAAPSSGGPPPVGVTPPPPPPPPPTGAGLTQADAKIGACVNLTNMLEPPNEGDWGRAYVDADFADIAAVGFKTLRLPARFSGHAMTTAPYTIDAAFMARVEKAVTLARAAGLRVIIDNHNYDTLMSSPAAESARFTAIWRQVSERFKDTDAMVWFELMNEPNTALTNANLLSIYNPAIAAIRATNPTRPIVVGGEGYSSVYSLASLPIVDEPNIIYTFHDYSPFPFTHQGAVWINPIPPMGTTFGSEADKDEIAADVARVTAFMQRTGKPIFMGEYGTIELVPTAQRAEHYKYVTDAFKAANVDGCVWGYVNTFNFRANEVGGAWNTQLLSAIGL